MNSFAVVTFVSCLAAAGWLHGWLHGHSALVPQGPSGKTSLVRPKRSHISAVVPGGEVVHEGHPAHAAPVRGHISTHGAPLLAHAAPVLAHPAAPSTIVAQSSAHGHDNVLVAGPSGTISTTQHPTTAVVFEETPSKTPMADEKHRHRKLPNGFSANLGIGLGH